MKKNDDLFTLDNELINKMTPNIKQISNLNQIHR